MIEIHTFKYGGKPHYSYPLHLVEQRPDLWILRGEYDRPLVHHTRGLHVPIKNESIEFVWPGRPYMVAVDVTGGKVGQYYCNIILPPTITEGRIEWVDLDLDLVVQPDLTYELIDQEDLEINSIKYGYPPEVIAGAWRAADELIALVKGRHYPFDGGALR